MSARFIIRVFDGRGSVHAGALTDFERACRRADGLAGRARRRGMNVSVSVRPLLGSAVRYDDVLDQLEDRGAYQVSSFGGRADRGEHVETETL
jgi:hypothetical protein